MIILSKEDESFLGLSQLQSENKKLGVIYAKKYMGRKEREN